MNSRIHVYEHTMATRFAAHSVRSRIVISATDYIIINKYENNFVQLLIVVNNYIEID
jgi:hypothetical protein